MPTRRKLSGGTFQNRKIRTGPRGGKYILKGGRKRYLSGGVTCSKLRKTKDPKCEEQEGCQWVTGKGCTSRNTSRSTSFPKKPAPKKKKQISKKTLTRDLTKIEKKLIAWNSKKSRITDMDIQAAVQDLLKGPYPASIDDKIYSYDDIPHFVKSLTRDAEKGSLVPTEIAEMYNKHSKNKLTVKGKGYLYGIVEYIYDTINNTDRDSKMIQAVLARFGMKRNKKVVTHNTKKPMTADAYGRAGGKEGDICTLRPDRGKRLIKMLGKRSNGNYYWKNLDWKTMDQKKYELHATCRYFS